MLGQQASGIHLLLSPSDRLQDRGITLDFSHGSWRSSIGPYCLQDKPFTNWAVAPAALPLSILKVTQIFLLLTGLYKWVAWGKLNAYLLPTRLESLPSGYRLAFPSLCRACLSRITCLGEGSVIHERSWKVQEALLIYFVTGWAVISSRCFLICSLQTGHWGCLYFP